MLVDEMEEGLLKLDVLDPEAPSYFLLVGYPPRNIYNQLSICDYFEIQMENHSFPGSFPMEKYQKVIGEPDRVLVYIQIHFDTKKHFNFK